MTSYNFTQQVNYPSYLTTQIATLGLAIALDHIDTDGSGPTMSVVLWFGVGLSGGDQITLTNFMATYADPTVSTNAINLILSALDTDSNVILVARTRIKQTVPVLDVLTQLQLCTLLGVNPNA